MRMGGSSARGMEEQTPWKWRVEHPRTGEPSRPGDGKFTCVLLTRRNSGLPSQGSSPSWSPSSCGMDIQASSRCLGS